MEEKKNMHAHMSGVIAQDDLQSLLDKVWKSEAVLTAQALDTP